MRARSRLLVAVPVLGLLMSLLPTAPAAIGANTSTTTAVAPWLSYRRADADGTREPRAGVDSYGHVHVAWSNYEGLWYLTNASGSWVTTRIAHPADTIQLESWWVTQGGKVYALYYAAGDGGDLSTRGLYWRSNASGTWVTKRSDRTADRAHLGYGAAIAAYADKVYVVYPVSGTIYEDWPSAVWLQTWTSGAGPTSLKLRDQTYDHSQPALDVDGKGKLHLAMVRTGGVGPDVIAYMTNKTGTWVAQTIPSVSVQGGIDMAADPEGTVHVAYETCISPCDFSSAQSQIGYTTNRGGTWTRRLMAGVDNLFPTIGYSAAGVVHIAYYQRQESSERIRYVTNSGGTWVGTNFDLPKLANNDWASHVFEIRIAANSGRVYIVDSEDECCITLHDSEYIRVRSHALP